MKRWRLVIALLAAAIAPPRVTAALGLADFPDFSLRDASNNVLLPGRLYVPPSARGPSAAPRPLMTMLHGGGGNGTDNLAQLNFISDGMIKAADERGALIYVPQAPSGWGTTTVTSRVMTMIDRALGEWNVDNDRLYMMGYSNGGGGTWNMLSRYDGRFAAAIAMSGVTPGSDFVASRLVNTPIVAIHARDDATVNASISRNIITNILSAGHEPLPTYLSAANPATFFLSNANIESHREFRELIQQMGGATNFLISNPQHDLIYFEPAGGGHTGLLGAFNADELYGWLFSHTTGVPEPGAACVLAPIVLAFAIRRHPRFK
jgi:poly(3-hydroxybutyrate) depolymerase